MGTDESKERLVRYTAEEIDEMIARGEDRTDWERVRNLTDEEIEASIDFEWDEDKRRANIIKHGFDFRDVQRLFDGRPVAEEQSSHPDEHRMLTIGILHDVFITAIWTERQGKVRLISTRRARRNEIAYYREQHPE